MSIPVEIVGKANDLTDWLIVSAALVQAVGTIVAIYWAGKIARDERREAQKHEGLAKARSLAALMELALKHAHVAADCLAAEPVAAERLWMDGTIEEASRQVNRAEKALRRVPVFALDDERLIEALLEFRDGINLIRSEIRAGKRQLKAREGYPPGPINCDFRDWFAEIQLARNTVLSIARGH